MLNVIAFNCLLKGNLFSNVVEMKGESPTCSHNTHIQLHLLLKNELCRKCLKQRLSYSGAVIKLTLMTCHLHTTATANLNIILLQ